MKTTKEPTASAADADRQRDAGTPLWEAMYHSLLAELTTYFDIAVSRAVATMVAQQAAVVTAAQVDRRVQVTVRPYAAGASSSPLPPTWTSASG